MSTQFDMDKLRDIFLDSHRIMADPKVDILHLNGLAVSRAEVCKKATLRAAALAGELMQLGKQPSELMAEKQRLAYYVEMLGVFIFLSGSWLNLPVWSQIKLYLDQEGGDQANFFIQRGTLLDRMAVFDKLFPPQLTEVVRYLGAMSKALEAHDHMEDYPVRQEVDKAVFALVVTLIGLVRVSAARLVYRKDVGIREDEFADMPKWFAPLIEFV